MSEGSEEAVSGQQRRGASQSAGATGSRVGANQSAGGSKRAEGAAKGHESEGERSRVTRQDRAIKEDGWIIDFLRKAGMISVATAQDGQPFLSTLLFVYDEGRHAIYIHTGKRGRMGRNPAPGAPACLTAARMGRLLPADTALNFSVEYQSVVIFGALHPVEDESEAEAALQMLLDKYFSHLRPGVDYRPITPGELALTAVFRVDVEEWSGKQKAVGEDFPGALAWG